MQVEQLQNDGVLPAKVTAVSYIKQVENEMFDRVTLTARSFFIAVLQKAACLKAVKIPPKAWYVIFSTWKSPMTIFSFHQLCTSLGTWWPGLVSVSTILTPGWFLMQSLKGCFVWEKKLVNQSWTASDSLTWWTNLWPHRLAFSSQKQMLSVPAVSKPKTFDGGQKSVVELIFFYSIFFVHVILIRKPCHTIPTRHVCWFLPLLLDMED